MLQQASNRMKITPACVPIGMNVPRGLLGTIVLVLAVEGFVSRRDLDLTGPVAPYFAFPARACGEAKRSEILCFGDSMVKLGIVPRVLEARLSKSAYNLAIPGATPPATYLMLHRALAAGARPTAILVNFSENNLRFGPQSQIDSLAEFATLRDCADLAWSGGSARYFGSLAIASLVPTVRHRIDVRLNVLGAFAGVSTSRRAEILAIQRNWRINQGAQLFSDAGANTSIAEYWDENIFYRPDFLCEPWNGICLIKFLKLAAGRGIPVYWLVTPIHPRVQAKRDRLGIDEAYTRFIGKAVARFPHLRVIDGRSAGFDSEMFADAGHLHRRGALAFSAEVAEVLARELAGPVEGPRWVTLPASRSRAPAVPVEDVAESALALSKNPEGRRR